VSSLVRLLAPACLLVSVPLLGVAACVDAPITPAQLEADGQLKHDAGQAVFGAEERVPNRQRAERLQLTAVLAGVAEGPLEDKATFILGEDESVNLHLRADKLDESRPVTFTWIHGEDRLESMGFLNPTETLKPYASHELSDEDTGEWTVEVHSGGPFGAVVYEREFEVVSPEV